MAALEYSPVIIPFARGLGLDMDARMRPPERLQVAENCYSAVTNRLEKRKGYTRLSRARLDLVANIHDNGPVRALGACGDELLAIGHRDLFGYLSAQDRWIRRGHVAPGTGHQRDVWRAHGNYESGDVATSGAYVVRAASRAENLASVDDDTGSAFRFTLEYEVLDQRDVYVLSRREHESGTTTGTKPRCPRLVNGTAHVGMYYGVGTTPATLKRCHFLDSGVSTGFSASTNISTDLWMDPAAGTVARTWDACQVSSGADYVEFCAFIDDTAKDVQLRGHTNTGTQTQTSSIAGTFTRCAVAQDGAAAVNVYVLALSTAEPSTLLLYARRRSDLTAVWGPITIYTPGGGEVVDNLSVVEGIDSSGNTKVMCQWTVYRNSIDADGADQWSALYCRTTNTAGGSLSTAIFAFNTLGTSRPFVYRNRFYTEAIVWLKATGFCSRMLVDLGNPSTTDSIRIAGMPDVGGPNVANQWGLVGSCNNVPVMADSVTFRHVAISAVEAESFDDVTPRLGIDECSYTLDVAPLVAQLPGPAAVIGGAYVTYYDGSRTFEMGFAAPPVIDTSTGQTGAIGLPNGVYTLYLHWAHADGRGALHRSLPSPPLVFTVTGGPRTLEVEWRTLPCSRRPVRETTALYYRAGTDGIAYRRFSLGETAPNKDDQFLGDNWLDLDVVQPTLVPIYTTGGILEAVAPVGCRIPLATRERLWLGGFDFVQWSKRITPNTTGDQVIAPEMMEALGRLVPTGEQVTGLGELGEATAIFTEKAIYLVAGEGPDARGAGDNMSLMAAIPVDDGCQDPRSVASFSGGVVFRGRRGFCVLTQGQTVKPIGEAVRTTLDLYPNTTSACVVPSEDQIRFTVDDGSTGKVLVWDYLRDEWFTWTIRTSDAAAIKPVGGTVVDGTHYVLDSNGYPWKQSTTAYFDNDGTDEYVPEQMKTAWVQPAGPGLYYRLGRIILSLDRAATHVLIVKLYTDYDETTPKVTWTLTQAQIAALADPGNMERFNIRVPSSYAKGTAFMLEVLDDPGTGGGTGAGFRALSATLFMAGLPGPARTGSQAMV